MTIYSFISSLDKQTLFFYTVIIIFFIFIFMFLPIGVNIIFGIILAIAIILYLYGKYQNMNQFNENNINNENMIDNNNNLDNIFDLNSEQEKLNYIIPQPKNFNGNKDLIDFIFSIQDFYLLNPQAYEELINNLDNFLQLRKYIFDEDELSNYYYQIAESKKDNALNSLQSLIFTMPSNEYFNEKLKKSMDSLNLILNKYMNEIYDKCQDNVLKNGKNIYSKQINTGPKEYNTYIDKNFTYQFF